MKHDEQVHGLPFAAAVDRPPWWRRVLRQLVRPPAAILYCARCGNVLGEPQQRWRRGDRRRIECFGPVDIAEPGDPARIVCIRLEHVRWYA